MLSGAMARSYLAQSIVSRRKFLRLSGLQGFQTRPDPYIIVRDWSLTS
jgi:hypothetical protein